MQKRPETLLCETNAVLSLVDKICVSVFLEEYKGAQTMQKFRLYRWSQN